MEANNELTRTQLLASPPTRLEDVDVWLAKYNAVIDAARSKALRVERLRDAAPDLVKALREVAQDLRAYTKPINEDGETVADIFACVLKQADAALAKSGA